MPEHENGWQTLLALAVDLAIVAVAIWLVARWLKQRVRERTRLRYERLAAARQRLNEERARRGLDPFPELAAMQAAAEDLARQLHPAGFRGSDGVAEPGEGPIKYGVFVVPETIPHPEAKEAPLRGEFAPAGHSYFAGIADEAALQGRRLDIDRAIVLFYASFMALFPFRPAAEIMAEVADVVEHEVQHLADAEQVVPYARSLSRQDDLSNYWWRRRRRRRIT